ncbi:MAG TPA: ABC transporter permease [Dehalococcoidia bacterium]|jgi:peptide/nickel transport system permease protein|nr:ABC transporter permease [Dehalococcoidia bacterium]
MSAYLTRRLIGFGINLVLVSMFVFTLLRLVPGDAAANILGVEATPEALADFREKHGLNGSLLEQYSRWAGGIIQGDFGKSLWSHTSVTSTFLDRLPVTLEIVMLSFTFSMLIGITSGIFSALRQNSLTDISVRVFAIFGLAVPNFLILTLLLIVPARIWGYAPPFGATNPFDSPVDNLRLFIPPTLLLSISSSAVLMRFTRSGFLEVLRQDYIRTARAKGLEERVVTMRHAFRNALPPVLTLAGLQLGGLLSGSIILERVMGLPGLGTWTLDAIGNKDIPVVMIVSLYTATVLMTINLVIDLAYGLIDPRIRVG